MYQKIVKPLLFQCDPEWVHHKVFSWLTWATSLGLLRLYKRLFAKEHPALERTVFGLHFKNPVGLAAGFDKDALCVQGLSDLGFGFIEVGTLTPKAQPGNPPKRLFRLPKDQAIINRMGFNNQGVDAAVQRLRRNKTVLVGGNIGKNKVTENQDALSDYLICLESLYPVVDYFVVNVSSPNTPGLRALQDKEPLMAMLTELKKRGKELADVHASVEKPILLKIAPDLTQEQLMDIVEIIQKTHTDGVIATNTTVERGGLHSDQSLVEQVGGLSGKPLTQRSTEVIRFLHQHSGGSFPIIGVGGIHSAQDALDKFEAGASLVQLYTGFVYEGPGLIRSINQALIDQAQKSSPI